MEKRRCSFALGTPEYPVPETVLRYHDTRWCRPEHRDRELFAMLILEGMQAGLSWTLVLNKEKNIRRAFDGFDPELVAAYGGEKLEALRQDPGIIRSRQKLRSAVSNAKAFRKIQAEFGSFDTYIWSFTDGKVVDHHLPEGADLPARDALSEKISADLKKRGFSYVGPVILYSYLQGIGIINDHWETCEYR